MNSTIASIKSVQDAAAAKKAEEAAAAARQKLVIDNGMARCQALIDEFNSTPMTLQRDRQSIPTWVPLGCSSTSSSLSDKVMDQLMALGMRVFLVWKADGNLVATLNCERIFADKVVPESNDPNRHLAVKKIEFESLAMMNLEAVKVAVLKQAYIGSANPNCCEIGSVLKDGTFTTEGGCFGKPKPENVHILPSEFIGAILRRMAPFLKVTDILAPVSKKPKKGKT